VQNITHFHSRLYYVHWVTGQLASRPGLQREYAGQRRQKTGRPGQSRTGGNPSVVLSWCGLNWTNVGYRLPWQNVECKIHWVNWM